MTSGLRNHGETALKFLNRSDGASTIESPECMVCGVHVLIDGGGDIFVILERRECIT